MNKGAGSTSVDRIGIISALHSALEPLIPSPFNQERRLSSGRLTNPRQCGRKQPRTRGDVSVQPEFGIYLMGYVLHLCVESTLRQGHDLGYNTTVIYDASAAFTRDQQTSFLSDIVPFYGRALTTHDFLKSAE